jgi:hypothetical protein
MSGRDPQDPTRFRWAPPRGLQPSETLTPDESGPYHVRQVGPQGPFQVVARDGWSIMATVHAKPGAEQRAMEMAAAGELRDAAEEVIGACATGGLPLAQALDHLKAAFERAQRQPIPTTKGPVAP